MHHQVCSGGAREDRPGGCALRRFVARGAGDLRQDGVLVVMGPKIHGDAASGDLRADRLETWRSIRLAIRRGRQRQAGRIPVEVTDWPDGPQLDDHLRWWHEGARLVACEPTYEGGANPARTARDEPDDVGRRCA